MPPLLPGPATIFAYADKGRRLSITRLYVRARVASMSPARGDLQVRGAMRVETRIGVRAGIRGPRFRDYLCPGAVAAPTCFRRWRGCSCRHVVVEIVGIAGARIHTERGFVTSVR